VHAVRDGAQAVVEMQGGCQPGLVLTDVMMPNMDGKALLRWMRRERPGVPVVGISSGLKDDGFDEFVQKPVELSDFRETMSRWLLVEPLDPDADRLASIIA
jgi:CheY-like chemotaxis protein